jgi:hypothetical protein
MAICSAICSAKPFKFDPEPTLNPQDGFGGPWLCKLSIGGPSCSPGVPRSGRPSAGGDAGHCKDHLLFSGPFFAHPRARHAHAPERRHGERCRATVEADGGPPRLPSGVSLRASSTGAEGCTKFAVRQLGGLECDDLGTNRRHAAGRHRDESGRSSRLGTRRVSSSTRWHGGQSSGGAVPRPVLESRYSN